MKILINVSVFCLIGLAFISPQPVFSQDNNPEFPNGLQFVKEKTNMSMFESQNIFLNSQIFGYKTSEFLYADMQLYAIEYSDAIYSEVNNVGVETSWNTNCDVTGRWQADYPTISMYLIQDGNSIKGIWSREKTEKNGCIYIGKGIYDTTTDSINITFVTEMDPNLCCRSFKYSGNLYNCNAMYLQWFNGCNFYGDRQLE